MIWFGLAVAISVGKISIISMSFTLKAGVSLTTTSKFNVSVSKTTVAEGARC